MARQTFGAFHEGLNMAAVWKLPVDFVCQNNLYGEHTPMAMSTGVPFISERGAAYGMPGVTVNGNDPVATWKVMGDAMEYMGKVERKAAMDADPVVLYREWLVTNGHATDGQLAESEETVTAAIDDAVEFAMNSPFPDESELYTDVYAEAPR